MQTIEVIYLVSFFLGLGFAIISGLLSGVFSGAGEAAGNVDIHAGHVDAGGHPVGAGDSIHLSPVSPITIAMFIASFGGSGIIMHKYFQLPMAVHIPAAGVIGFAIAAAVFYFFAKVMGISEVSSSPRPEEAVGLEAEILTSIPAEGVGEIAYTLRESRFTAPAKTLDGKELPARMIVKIVKIVGGTYFVEKAR
jgi:membrane protein implicated in regulation of membrane protease activity